MSTVKEALAEHLDAVVPPPADLASVERRGRAIRRKRRRNTAMASGLVVAVVAGTALLAPRSEPTSPNEGFEPLGQLDFSEGLRAFASPGDTVYLGGRSFPIDRMKELDTDAAATAYGIVFLGAGGRPMLLQESGEVTRLGQVDGVRSTVKADAKEPYVVWAASEGEQATLTVFDLAKNTVVATREVQCGSACDEVDVDGIDSSVVFVRTKVGTFLWNFQSDDWTEFAGPDTRVADVRNRVVLYDGPAPTLPLNAWRYVRGAIDAQLTFDGGHILYWSSKLEPTFGGRAALSLDLPKDANFFTIDTDGSVLAATSGDPTVFYDCEVPSGVCERLAEVEVTGGDPMFIGND